MTALTGKMQQRRDTAANWTSSNPTLAAGEIGLESDTGAFKMGDGATAWTSLGYVRQIGFQEVFTDETTSSTTFADLATVGPSVTVTVGKSGLLKVDYGALCWNNTLGAYCFMSVSLSGANTVTASGDDRTAVLMATVANGPQVSVARSHLFTGLTPGVTTAKCVYRTNSGASIAHWQRRWLIAEAIGNGKG